MRSDSERELDALLARLVVPGSVEYEPEPPRKPKAEDKPKPELKPAEAERQRLQKLAKEANLKNSLSRFDYNGRESRKAGQKINRYRKKKDTKYRDMSRREEED